MKLVLIFSLISGIIFRYPTIGPFSSMSDELNGAYRNCIYTTLSWCVVESRTNVRERVNFYSNNEIMIEVYGSHWKRNPLAISFSHGCEFGTAQRVRVISYDDYEFLDGRYWQKIIISLSDSDKCVLTFFVPTLSDDSMGTAYSRVLGDIRVCSDYPCRGDLLGNYVWRTTHRV